MKATLIALMLGGALPLAVSSPATTHAVEEITLNWTEEKVEILEPHGMVLHESVCRPDDPNAGVAASCATDPPDGRLGQAVVQLTYAPGGVRRLFNLVEIDVSKGPLGVGIQYEDGTIAVYRDLGSGRWGLPGATNIDRVTLECTSDSYPNCMSPEALRKMIGVKSLTLELDPNAEPAASARFVVLGDTGTIGSGEKEDGQNAVAAALAEWCNVHGCNFALLLGDNFYPSGVGSCTGARFNTTFEVPYSSRAHPTWPYPIQHFYSVLGNHDYGNGGGPPFMYDRGGHQYQYTDLKPTACKPPTWKRSGRWRMGNEEDPSYPVVGDPDPREPYRYYAFRQGNAQFLALDTTPMVAERWSDNTGRMTTYVKTQQEKLLKAMDPEDGRWKIALGHHPYVSNGAHGNAGQYDMSTDPNTKKVEDPNRCKDLTSADQTNGWACGWRLQTFFTGVAATPTDPKLDGLCERGLDLYLSGHDHNLPWLSAPCGNRQVEFIVAGAGAKLTPCIEERMPDHPSQVNFCERGNSTRFQEKTLGFVYIVITGQSMDVRFIDASNLAELHRESRSKRP
jgi:tartrate-resistant acid phosphatase type 5